MSVTAEALLEQVTCGDLRSCSYVDTDTAVYSAYIYGAGARSLEDQLYYYTSIILST